MAREATVTYKRGDGVVVVEPVTMVEEGDDVYHRDGRKVDPDTDPLFEGSRVVFEDSEFGLFSLEPSEIIQLRVHKK